MQAAIKEIATLLRSTDDMAAQFVQRVQNRVGPAVTPAEVLAAMKKVPSKSLTMEKVVAKLQQQQRAAAARSPRRAAQRPVSTANSRQKPSEVATATPSSSGGVPVPTTIMDRLEAILRENWDRAEAEGLQPERMEAEAFIKAIYQYTDRREGTRRRILQAAKQLNQADVVLTPALVADTVHELFES